MILLRAELNNAGANITEFRMESAQLLNVGLGAANLVEECQCPQGYKGRSCEVGHFSHLSHLRAYTYSFFHAPMAPSHVTRKSDTHVSTDSVL